MGWESRKGRGRYYTRTRRIGGRFIREYLGTGPRAEDAAAEDARRRAERQAEVEARRTTESRWREADVPLCELEVAAKLVLAAALAAAGYRQHDRGAWRRRRHARQRED